MHPDFTNTSVLSVNGIEVCRISHDDKDFREEVVMDALRKLAPYGVNCVPQKFWGFIRDTFNNGRRIDAIKLVRIIEPEFNLGEAKELTEFIASANINL